MPTIQRLLTPSDHVAARVDPGMQGVYGTVFVGAVQTVYLIHNDASRWYHAGWVLVCGPVVRQVRMEKTGVRLALAWASEGFPSEK